MTQVFCHDCSRSLANGTPRVVYSDRGYDGKGGQTTIMFYVCGDCEYKRQVKK